MFLPIYVTKICSKKPVPVAGSRQKKPVKRIQLYIYSVQEQLSIDATSNNISKNNNKGDNETLHADSKQNDVMIQLKNIQHQLELGLALVRQTI
jgi:hypothetical protein